MKRLDFTIYTRLIRPIARLALGWLVGIAVLIFFGTSVLNAMGMKIHLPGEAPKQEVTQAQEPSSSERSAQSDSSESEQSSEQTAQSPEQSAQSSLSETEQPSEQSAQLSPDGALMPSDGPASKSAAPAKQAAARPKDCVPSVVQQAALEQRSAADQQSQQQWPVLDQVPAPQQ